ncbi:hypothetical protein JCM6882_002097 [Rhodosporidiobolus microsporus]
MAPDPSFNTILSLSAPDKPSANGVDPSRTTSSSAASPPLAGPRSTAPLKGSAAPLAYILIRWLFRFVLGVFYSSVVVEGEELVPEDGIPCMLTANHSNSLTDALLLVTTVPSSRRSLIRLTAKDTQFGRGTFSSWLIEAAGTLPIKRPKDHRGEKVDNSVVFEKLISSLEMGDAVCVFPEGMSRYHPEIAPLRQGVSRIISDTLTRQRDNTNFRLAVQTCSITYLHRNLFRSDVLVTFHHPIYVSSSTHPALLSPSSPTPSSSSTTAPTTTTPEAHESAIRALTSQISTSLRSGILDAPSWAHLRLANTARRLYAPLGTRLTLGDHVRLTQRFVDALVGKVAVKKWGEGEGEGAQEEKKEAQKSKRKEEVWKTPMRERKPKVDGAGFFAIEANGNGAATDEETDGEADKKGEKELEELRRDLKDLLYLHGLKDDRIRNPVLLHRRTLLRRLVIRAATSVFLFLCCLPGLWMWVPVFWATKKAQGRLLRGGPKWDTYDEIAQTKLVVGLGAGLSVLALSTLVTTPFLPLINLALLPTLMWLTLRFLEDLFSSLRALLALLRLLLMGKRQLTLLREMRAQLRERVEAVAVERAGLPRDAGVFVKERERRWKLLGLGRVEEGVAGWLGFFDVRRRRKKDWNEALKLFDQVEYGDDDEDAPPPALPSEKKAVS